MNAKGNLLGLKPSLVRQIERLAERRAGVECFVEPPFALAIQDAAILAQRRIGVLVDRRGVVQEVFVGDAADLPLPRTVRRRCGPGRLCGERLVFVDLSGRGHTPGDLERLRLLSLDASVAVLAGQAGRMPLVEVAHLLPENTEGRFFEVLKKTHPGQVPVRFDETVRTIEAQMRRDAAALMRRAKDAAILVLPVFDRTRDVEWELLELEALCRTAGLAVVASVVQKRPAPDARFLIGRGKVREVAMLGLYRGADLLVFGAPLTPSQQRSVAKETGLRVIDRNQLILDIFARHAHTVEGRMEVELAQLRYNLPRLSEKDDSMSRLTGGIGALGPGETKLEMERRRARDRIHMLEERLLAIAADRAERRRRRMKQEVPMVALVGYTNAGKSTIFNALTGADVLVEEKLFATLSPTVRRLQASSDVVLCDTVGFIRDLPEELRGAFGATVEEVSSASLLILVADASDEHLCEQVASTRRILGELDLLDKPMVLALNKADLLQDKARQGLLATYPDAFLVSAKRPESLRPLVEEVLRLVASYSTRPRSCQG